MLSGQSVNRNNPFDYAMYSDTGNAVIHGIVLAAKHNGITKNYWHEIVEILQKLSNEDGFREAMDTAVREEIWCALFE